jgi:hypothetical protein
MDLILLFSCSLDLESIILGKFIFIGMLSQNKDNSEVSTTKNNNLLIIS